MLITCRLLFIFKVTCSNLLDVSGKTTFLFRLSKFNRGGSEYSNEFPCGTNNEEFVRHFNNSMMENDTDQQHDQRPIETSPINKFTPPKPVSRKTKTPISSNNASSEFISPAKKQRVASIDEEISKHHLGMNILIAHCYSRLIYEQ